MSNLSGGDILFKALNYEVKICIIVGFGHYGKNLYESYVVKNDNNVFDWSWGTQ